MCVCSVTKSIEKHSSSVTRNRKRILKRNDTYIYNACINKNNNRIVYTNLKQTSGETIFTQYIKFLIVIIYSNM